MSEKFDIPKGLYDRARAAAEVRGVTPRRFLLDAMLEAVEDVEGHQAAERAMKEFREGDGKLYTLNELEEFIDVDSSLNRPGKEAVSKAS